MFEARYRPQSFVHRYPPQQLIFGEGSAARLDRVLDALDIGRALLICGENLGAQSGLLERIVSGSGARVVHVWSGARPHSPARTVEDAAAAYRFHTADGLVSLGGGSAHDTMRAVSLMIQSGLAMLEHFQDRSRAFTRFEPEAAVPRIPMVAIPTTLSAAETTYGGGVTAEKRKYVFFGERLFIDRIILDPRAFETTPAAILVSTGLNAVNHALERLCSPRHQPIGDAAFIHALRLLLPSLAEIHDRGLGEGVALTDAMLGAHLSESTNVLGGIGHAIAHVVGARYALPHGQAHALGILPGLALAGRRNRSGIAAISNVFRELGYCDAGQDPFESSVAVMRHYLRGLEMPARLSEVGVSSADLGDLAAEIMGDISAANAAREDLNAGLVEQLLQGVA